MAKKAGPWCKLGNVDCLCSCQVEGCSLGNLSYSHKEGNASGLAAKERKQAEKVDKAINLRLQEAT